MAPPLLLDINGPEFVLLLVIAVIGFAGATLLDALERLLLPWKRA